MDHKRVGKWVLFCIPLVIGIIGFITTGMSFLDSLFNSICLYGLEIQDSPPNWLIEIARWTAPIATASGVLMILSRARNSIQNWIKFKKGKSVAVYGPETERTALLEYLGSRGIKGDDSFVRAQQYVLLNAEEQNYSFYNQYRDKLRDAEVYMKCSSIRPQSVFDPNLRLFCAEETAARLFWKQHCLYKAAKSMSYRVKIVLIGFGKLGEELIDYALQDNIFSPNQCIEYHIFDGDTRYLEIRPQLENINDKIIFHAEPWSQSLALLEEASCILFLQQAAQTAIVTDLLLATKQTKLYVFSSETMGVELLEAQNRLILYPWQKIAQNPKYVLSDQLYDAAKRINLRYAVLYAQSKEIILKENDENKEQEWIKLNSFTRYSNISAADYHDIQVLMLQEDGESTSVTQMSKEQIEYLAELEHMRWCRYHWLNNWQFGIPSDGSNKDEDSRIHVDLQPYSVLPNKEKQKDRDNITLLFSLF